MNISARSSLLRRALICLGAMTLSACSTGYPGWKDTDPAKPIKIAKVDQYRSEVESFSRALRDRA